MCTNQTVITALRRLKFFAQYIKVRRMIEKIALDPKQTFWIMTANLLFDAAAIEWSKVFGSWEEDTHWTKSIPQKRHEEVREKLLKELGFKQKEWEDYRSEIVGYRNTLAAHHDLQNPVTRNPKYDKAIVAANFMYDRLREVADPNYLGDIPTSLENWSNNVAGNMSAIVLKAFKASATLGSNIQTDSPKNK